MNNELDTIKKTIEELTANVQKLGKTVEIQIPNINELLQKSKEDDKRDEAQFDELKSIKQVINDLVVVVHKYDTDKKEEEKVMSSILSEHTRFADYHLKRLFTLSKSTQELYEDTRTLSADIATILQKINDKKLELAAEVATLTLSDDFAVLKNANMRTAYIDSSTLTLKKQLSDLETELQITKNRQIRNEYLLKANIAEHSMIETSTRIKHFNLKTKKELIWL